MYCLYSLSEAILQELSERDGVLSSGAKLNWYNDVYVRDGSGHFTNVVEDYVRRLYDRKLKEKTAIEKEKKN